MTGWRDRAVCRRLPDFWWDLGDDSNRLAITLCRVACPVLAQCAAHDPAPSGIVRAGVAWSDTGEPTPICPCGRPITAAGRDTCTPCDPPLTDLTRHVTTIRRLAAWGWNDKRMAAVLGSLPQRVADLRRYHNIHTKRGRPRTPGGRTARPSRARCTPARPPRPQKAANPMSEASPVERKAA